MTVLVDLSHEFSVLGGANIQDAIKEASANSRLHNVTTKFVFNKLLIVVAPTTDPDKLLDDWYKRPALATQVGP